MHKGQLFNCFLSKKQAHSNNYISMWCKDIIEFGFLFSNSGTKCICGKWFKITFLFAHRTKLVLQNLEDSCLLNGDDDSLTDKHGCPAYVGPEILNSRHSYSGKAADIWSLGVVLYTMLVGRYPFQDVEPAALFSKIRRGAFTIPETLSPRAKSLVCCMLRKSPLERLEAPDILLHPWLHCSTNAFVSQLPNSRHSTDQVVPGFEKCDERDCYWNWWSTGVNIHLLALSRISDCLQW